jgi:histidinol-phosphate/aromatic aminotransferase/cobyric acid decarboxylase-like protein
MSTPNLTATLERIQPVDPRWIEQARARMQLTKPNAFHASEVRERLIWERAILVRECDSFEGLAPGRYLRIAVRREIENDRLTEALAAIIGQPTCQQHT